VLDIFKVGNKTFNAIEIPKFEGPYIVLEIFDRDKNIINGAYILDMSK